MIPRVPLREALSDRNLLAPRLLAIAGSHGASY